MPNLKTTLLQRILPVITLILAAYATAASTFGPFLKLNQLDESVLPVPAPTLEGALIYETSMEEVVYSDGTDWLTVGGGGYPYRCRNNVQTTYLMDAGVIELTKTANNLYSVVCNSRENSSGNVRCRTDDAGVPTMTTGSTGDVLGVGDCITYSQRTGPIECIGASVYVTHFECIK